MYYHSNGEIKGFPKHKLRPWPLKAVLEEKYRWGKEQAEQFCSWLLPMMALRPEDRLTAAASAEHRFLTGAQVGEKLGECDKGNVCKRKRELDGEKLTASRSKKFKQNKVEDRKTKNIKENKSKDEKLEMKPSANKLVSLKKHPSQLRNLIKNLESDNKEVNSVIERKLEESKESSMKLNIAQKVIVEQSAKMEVMKEQIKYQKLLIKAKDNDMKILKEENAELIKKLEKVRGDFEGNEALKMITLKASKFMVNKHSSEINFFKDKLSQCYKELDKLRSNYRLLQNKDQRPQGLERDTRTEIVKESEQPSTSLSAFLPPKHNKRRKKQNKECLVVEEKVKVRVEKKKLSRCERELQQLGSFLTPGCRDFGLPPKSQFRRESPQGCFFFLKTIFFRSVRKKILNSSSGNN